MKTKLGVFVLGSLSAYLLDPVSGPRRRDQARKWLAPVTKRLARAKESAAAHQPHDIASVGATVVDASRSVITTVRDKAHDVPAAVQARLGHASDAASNGYESDGHDKTPLSDRMPLSRNPSHSAADLAPLPIDDPIPEGQTNDPTLVARVESELFRDETLPKGKINIDAANGTVTVRGTLGDDNLANDIVERIQTIEGVSQVVDLLHRG